MTATQYDAMLNGQWVTAAQQLDVHNPSNWDEVIANVPALAPDDVAAAMAHAREGAKTWAATNALTRSRILFKTAETLRSRAEDLAELLARENGKTLAEATGEVGKTAEFFEFYAGLARLPYGDLIHDARPNTTTTVRHVPIGVVLAITPWNDPLLTPARKLAPALASGNAVVLKPASDTPTIALELTRALLDSGLPSGVLTTVTGRARDIADVLIDSPHIDAITFTGSTEVGLDLQKRVAGRNMRVQCEMGGKNAAIVLEDADLDLAAETIAAAGFGQGGQRCTATSRVLVHSSVKDQLVDRLVTLGEKMVLGASTTEGTVLGPLVNPGHRDDVVAHVDRAHTQGATVRTGGHAPDGPLASGCFVLPTVLDDVTVDMSIWTDEVFGPVIAVVGIDTLPEAIDLANASDYGLSAALFTRSIESSDVFLRDIDCGQAAVNLPTSGWDVHHPFGGFKLSGSPFKEQGLEALNFYTRTKTCAVRSA